ncbi:sorting protein 39 domain 2 [Metschnikowia aff. pulcherrima]|uniref:Sorting protein 39 domain 2 n=1 Tax=Metschnikowia aff. pulcherrima TaxID=2163413 RepID=A0A4P6XR62_9ASCO|nr:sorting protein 39 domain 2 [Metschnikowia aff. pulcherrima]
MNATVLEPLNRLHMPSGTKVLALYVNGNRVYIGLSNGDLQIMRVSTENEREPARPEARLVKSFRSFSEVKRLFQENDNSQILIHEQTFANVLGNLAPITRILSLPLYSDHSRKVLLIGTNETLHVHEWVGLHLDLVRAFDEIRAYSCFEYVELDEVSNAENEPKPSSDTKSEKNAKLLLIGARKRLYIYKVVRKSRNIYDFVILREVLLKERIKEISGVACLGKALVATMQTVLCLDLNDDFTLQEISFDSSNTLNFTQTSSFSYFGLSSGGPHVSIVPLSRKKSFFVRDLEVGVLRVESDEPVFEESKISLNLAPSSVAYLLPCYVVFMYPKSFEVVDIESGTVVQTFKHLLGNTLNHLQLDSDMVTIAAGQDVFQFKVVSIQKQLESFLAMRGTVSSKGKKDPSNDLRLLGLERAIVLIENLDVNDAFFADRADSAVDKQKQLFLRDLFKEKAVIYFETYSKYHAALAELASEWMVSFHEILQLFPDFLNGSVQIKGKPSSTPKHSNPIRKITIGELQSGIENGRITSSDSDMKSTANSEIPKNIRNFHNAVQNLIVFLTDQRRVHLSFLRSSEEDPCIMWRNIELRASDLYPGMEPKILRTKLTEYASAIDTSLFLCYYFTKPMMLGPLLRLPHNRCNARVVNKCLLHGSSLGSRDQISFIGQLLDFYFGRALHEEALRLLSNLASENVPEKGGSSEYLTGPDLTIQYMQRLTNEHLDLIFKYAHWVLSENAELAIENAKQIFMNDSFECEGYDRFKVLDYILGVIKNDDMAIAYLEWLLHESDMLENALKKKEVPRLSTRLCLLYLKKMAALNTDGKTFTRSQPYQRMKKLLAGGIDYEPWTLLKNISDEDKYLRLTVLIYHRLGEHQKSVDILYNQLGDLDEAMQYCADVYLAPNGENDGQKLLFKLLEDLLMHYNENKDAIARLVTLQGHKMPTLQLLATLPNDFPLHKLALFLANTTRELEEKRSKLQLESQLYKIGASKIHYGLVMAQAHHYKVTGADQKCHICAKPLGHSVTCANNANQIVHYGCLDKRERVSQSS